MNGMNETINNSDINLMNLIGSKDIYCEILGVVRSVYINVILCFVFI